MRLQTLALRGLTYYRRTNVAVVLGVACAVAVLAGALTVGESVRSSLRELSVGRLGRADVAIVSDGYFRHALARELRADGLVTAPLVLADGLVADERSGQRASRVQVVGVDAAFWNLHGVSGPVTGRSDAWISPGLARDLGFSPGDTLLVRTRRPSEIPAEFLHGRRDDVGRTMRLRGAGVLPRERLGEFSLRPQQGEPRTLLVPIERLQRDLDVGGRVNAVIAIGNATRAGDALRRRVGLEDLGVRVRQLAPGVLAVESSQGVMGRPLADAAIAAARGTDLRVQPMFTYVVNSMRAGDREVPYSLITGIHDIASRPLPDTAIVVNDWTANELAARPGDAIEIEYYVWTDAGRLETRAAKLTLARIVPVDAADRDYAPHFPGISDTGSLADWDPPFPIDLSKIRPQDEAYWRSHRTTPKAFVPLRAAERLWGARWGSLTAVRVSGPADTLAGYSRALRARLDPSFAGMAVVPVREQALRASVGATDFGAYFTYFSFFITAAALLLAALFFRLGIEQRVQQIGVLRAVGYSPRDLRRLFLAEAAGLAAAGCLLGAFGAIAYAWLIMYGLRHWWVGAVGTTLLQLHPSWAAIAIGIAGGAAAGVIAMLVTLSTISRGSPRALMSGDLSVASRRSSAGGSRYGVLAVAVGVAAVTIAAAALFDVVNDVAGFFGAGTLLLGAALAAFSHRLATRPAGGIDEARRTAVARLGWRYASWRRGRSVLSATLVAAAVFLIVSVEAFRRDTAHEAGDRHSGTGGAALVAESLLPMFHDPDTIEGREALNLVADTSSNAVPAFHITAFRLGEGDDASCVNLYRPQRPRLIGAREEFLRANRFTFKSSLAASDAERANPWRLLLRREADGALPTIADATSLQYVLHRAVGDTLDSGRVDAQGRPVMLRIVGALADSVLQGELIIAEPRFTEAFPAEEGYRFFLVDVSAPGGGPPRHAAAVAAFLEERLSDFGFDATNAAERLASFHRVENTYLSTFQALGALGLLLGTLGLGAIAVRNVLERRRELALLRAIGYGARDLALIVIAENALLLVVGIASGLAAALLAIAPVLWDRGTGPAWSLTALVGAVLVAGLLSSAVAARASASASLLSALRSE